MRRPYQAPAQFLRCQALALTFAGGKEQAQCMRRYDENYHRNICFQYRCCAQHADMLLRGKTVVNFNTGLPFVLPIRKGC